MTIDVASLRNHLGRAALGEDGLPMPFLLRGVIVTVMNPALP